MAYKTQQISTSLLKNTKDAWKLIVGEEEFLSEFAALFDWLDARRNYENPHCGNSLGYAIVDDGHHVAAGFIEVVSSTNKGGLTKLLKVYLSPQFWDVEEHKEEVMSVFMAAILGVVSISADHRSRTIKIFGRTDSLFSLVQSLNESIRSRFAESDEVNISSNIEGRWLVISCG